MAQTPSPKKVTYRLIWLLRDMLASAINTVLSGLTHILRMKHHSYENETQPNTRCRPSHLSRTIHSSHKGNLGFSRCLHRKGGEIRPRKYHRHQNFRQEGYVYL